MRARLVREMYEMKCIKHSAVRGVTKPERTRKGSCSTRNLLVGGRLGAGFFDLAAGGVLTFLATANINERSSAHPRITVCSAYVSLSRRRPQRQQLRCSV
jgi:hypothetical protein